MVLAAAGLFGQLCAQNFVYQNDREFVTSADLDGDTIEEAIIVDRATGGYRVIFGKDYSQIIGHAGFGDITGFAAGAARPVTSLGLDELYFTSPEAGFLSTSTPRTSDTPVAATRLKGSELRTPYQLAFSEVGDIGKTVPSLIATSHSSYEMLNQAEREFAYLGEEPWANLPIEKEWLSEKDGELSLRKNYSQTRVLEHLRALAPDTNEPELLVGITGEIGSKTLVMQDADSSSDRDTLALPAGSDVMRWTYGYFDSASLATIFAYEPNASGFLVIPCRSGGFDGAITSISTSKYGTIDQLFVVPHKSGRQDLLILFDGGTRAVLFEFKNGKLEELEDLSSGPLPKGATDSFAGVIPWSQDGFLLLKADGDMKTNGGVFFASDGDGYRAVKTIEIGETSLQGPSNILIFENEPFVDSAPRLRQRLYQNAWTSAIDLSGGTIDLQVESFVGVEQGLGGLQAITLGAADPSQHGLANQIHPAISMYNEAAPTGPVVSALTIQPGSGEYTQSVRFEINSSEPFGSGEPLKVYYRLTPHGAWLVYDPSNPPASIFQTTTVFAYAENEITGLISPIVHQTYTINTDPTSLDSDGDGVPDYVEIENGLDPFFGADSDGDGVNDLAELLSGTSPGDASDFPYSPLDNETGNDTDGDGFSDLVEERQGTDPNEDGIFPDAPELFTGYSQDIYNWRAQPVLDLPELLPGAQAEKASKARSSAVRVYNSRGVFLNSATNLLDANGEVTALIENLPLGVEEFYHLAKTDSFFHTVPSLDSEPDGRAMVGLHRVDAIAYTPFSLEDQGSTLGQQASAWAAEARLYYETIEASTHLSELTPETTLELLIFERLIANLLFQRLQFGKPIDLSLTPFREGETGRTPTIEELQLIESYQKFVSNGYKIENVLARVEALVRVESRFPEIQELLALAYELYAISARYHHESPGAYPQPLDELRRFLSTGKISGSLDEKSGYIWQLGETSLDLDLAATALNTIRASLSERPIVLNLELYVRSDSFSSSCTTLYRVSDDTPVDLVNPNGTPLLFPERLTPLVGSTVRVSGYSDAEIACSPESIEVFSTSQGGFAAQFASFPSSSAVDSDGNLIDDEWENALLGGPVTDPLQDSDGDGYSDLQESLDLTDPRNPSSSSSQPPVDLSPPSDLEITIAGGFVTISFSFPGEYADRIGFELYTSDDLSAFDSEALYASYLGGDSFEVTLPVGGLKEFYLFKLFLK